MTYVSRNHLNNLLSPQRVADRWHEITTTADRFMGYEGFRKRNDSAVTDRDIVAGYGHAGYPMFMAYFPSVGSQTYARVRLPWAAGFPV